MSHRRPVRRRSRLLAALGALTVCTVACAAPAPAAPAAPPSPFPPRPYAIDVTKVDPCSALTADQARRRGATKGKPGTTDLGIGALSKGCNFINFDDGYGYIVQTIETDAAVGLQTPGKSSVIAIDGFGAVSTVLGKTNVTGPGQPQFCQVLVDVNTNQSIRLLVGGPYAATYGTPAEEKKTCDLAQALARDVLTTLSDQQR